MTSHRDANARVPRLRAIAVVAAVVAALSVAAPAQATGWLVHVEAGGWFVHYGTNPTGTTGDFLDVGILNYQCSDEQDVIDVSVLNTEGGGSCGWGQCASDSAGDGDAFLPILGPVALGPDPIQLAPVPLFEPEPAACSDNADIVDVGILNDEGHFKGDYRTGCEQGRWGKPGTDLRDFVDVGILNRECQDRQDFLDVGLANCEYDDRFDTVDLAYANFEDLDHGDAFDFSAFNLETVEDPPSATNVYVGPPAPIGCGLDVDPVYPCVRLPNGRYLCVEPPRCVELWRGQYVCLD